MPTSYTKNFPHIMGLIEVIQPESVLDIGPGYGHYGFAIRERIDNFKHKVVIDAVEAFQEYMDRSQAWEYIYDDVIIGDWVDETNDQIHNISLKPKQYDLVLMIDVLEHFDEEDAFWAVEKASYITNQILISTPIGYKQGPVGGNKFEEHKSEWERDKMQGLADRLHLNMLEYSAGTSDSRIYLLFKN